MTQAGSKPISRGEDRKYIVVIWAVFIANVLASMGRYSYSTVMIDVIAALDCSNTDAGTVTSMMFFSYAVGQIVVSALITKMPASYPSTIALVCSAAINFAMPFCGVGVMKWLWLINGAAHAFLYLSSMEFLSKHLPEHLLRYGATMMGLFTVLSQVILYLLSALCARVADWKTVFYVSAICTALAAAIWFFVVRASDGKAVRTAVPTLNVEREPRTKHFRAFFLTMLLVAAVVAFCKQALSVWSPVILKSEEFGMESSTVYLLMNCMVIVMTCGVFAGSFLFRRLKNPNRIILLISLFIVPITLAVGFFLRGNAILFVVAICALTCLIQIGSTVSIGFSPMMSRAYISAGLFSGLANSAACLGNVIAGYGLGSLLDARPWYVLFFILAGTVFATMIPLILSYRSSEHLVRK